MKYTKDNIQGLICSYKHNNITYLVDTFKRFKNDGYNIITWSEDKIVDGFNTGAFKEIGNLNNNYEIY